MSSDEGLFDRPTRGRSLLDAALALCAGWLLYVLSCWLVEPSMAVGSGFEVDWQMMSEDPFALRGRFPHRVLAPLLAWSLGYGGEGYLPFTHGLHVLLLASVCFVALRLRAGYVGALLVGAAVAVTAPTQMYKLHWNGYTDPICYTLFLWMLLAARRPAVFWSLFLVNLTNHELAGFLLPWLFFLRRCEDGRWKTDLVWIGVTCGVYLGYYLLIKSQAAQLFSSDYFLSHPLFPGGSFVVWNLAGVHLVTTFGPVLALLAWHQHSGPARGERWHLWLVGLGVLVIFCIAFDWARHSNLLVLPLTLAAARFVGCGRLHQLVCAGVLALTLLLFWWVPPWTSTAWPTNDLANPVLLTGTGMLVIGSGEFDIGFGSLGDAVGRWLPAVWPILAAVHGTGVGIWLAGWGLTRLRKPMRTGGLTKVRGA